MFSKVTLKICTAYNALQIIYSSNPAQYFIDLTNFSFGFIGLRNLAKTYCFKDKKFTQLYDNFPPAQQTLWKIVDLMGNLSLILAGLNSQHAIVIWKWSAQKILSSNTLELLLKNGDRNYQAIKLISFLLGVPTTLKTCYFVYSRFINFYFYLKNKNKSTEVSHITANKMELFITVKNVADTAQFITSPQKKF